MFDKTITTGNKTRRDNVSHKQSWKTKKIGTNQIRKEKCGSTREILLHHPTGKNKKKLRRKVTTFIQ